MTRSHLSRRIIATSGAATLVAAAAAVAALAPATAADTTVTKTFNYTCDLYLGTTKFQTGLTIPLTTSVKVPASLYVGQSAPARTVKADLNMSASQAATHQATIQATTLFINGVAASGSSTDSYVGVTSNGKTSNYKIPSLAAPKASIPAEGTDWIIHATGTVPAIPTPASYKTSSTLSMPAKFSINSTVYKADKSTASVSFKCVGPSDLTIGTVAIVANNIPTAAAVKATTKKNKAVTVTLKGADKDKTDKLTYKVGKAKHGKVTVKGNKATYTPTKNYTGKDSFTYTVSDGKADPVKATVSITVSK